jgi:hypothetical protein
VRDVLTGLAAPDVVQADLIQDVRRFPFVDTGEAYFSGFHPTFSPNGSRIAYVGYLDSLIGPFGDIAYTDVNTGVAAPAPTATPTPTGSPTPTNPPTPTPFPTENVVQQHEYNFPTTGDGWTFQVAAEGLGIEFSDAIGSRPTGLLRIVHVNNTNSYGFFLSPPRALDLFRVDLPEDTNPDDSITEQDLIRQFESYHYLLRFYIRRTTADADDAVTFRMRVNSEDVQDYMELIVNSLGENRFTPSDSEFQAVDMLFQPSPFIYTLEDDLQAMRIAFDIIGFDPADDPTGGHEVTRVDVFRVPLSSIESLETFRTFSFDTVPEQQSFEFYTNSIFQAPTAFREPGRLRIDQTTSNTTPTFHFGSWQNAFTGTTPENQFGRITADPAGRTGKP